MLSKEVAGTVHGPLSRAQLEEFRCNGAVLLPSLLEPGLCEHFRSQYWDELAALRPGTVRSDPSSWPSQAGRLPNVNSLRPQLGELPVIKSVVNQLAQRSGWKLVGGSASLKAIFPSVSASEWTPPVAGHVDGYGGTWPGSGLRVGMTAYIDDVDAHGGCFTYWPRGHIAVHQFFKRHPSTIDGSFQRAPDFAPGRDPLGWLSLYERAGSEPVEFVGRAGDVLLTHGLLPHCGSLNGTLGATNCHPRLALIARWHDPRYMEPDRPIAQIHFTGRVDSDLGIYYRAQRGEVAEERGALGWDRVDAEMRRTERRFELVDDWTVANHTGVSSRL